MKKVASLLLVAFLSLALASPGYARGGPAEKGTAGRSMAVPTGASTGCYHLQGDGVTVPYLWVWVPVAPAPPPPPSSP